MFHTRYVPVPSMMKLIGIISITITLFALPSNSIPDGCTESQYYETYKCDDGECIPLELVGDGIFDCNDKSDEKSSRQGDVNKVTQSSSRPDTLPNNGSEISTIQFEYDTYMEPLKGSLDKDKLEYLIDYEFKDSLLKKYRDFHPKRIFRILTDRAAKYNTPQDKFHKEMRILATRGDDICPNCGFDYGGESINEGYLLRKYNITKEARDSRTAVTPFRLRLIFPHYYDFGQKPFSNPPRIVLPNSFEVPAVLQSPEFGGIIPLSAAAFGETHNRGKIRRDMLIGLHLYMLSRNTEQTLPNRINCLIMLERMKTSMLSDDRRIRLLQNYEILTDSNNFFLSCKVGGESMPITHCLPLPFENVDNPICPV